MTSKIPKIMEPPYTGYTLYVGTLGHYFGLLLEVQECPAGVPEVLIAAFGGPGMSGWFTGSIDSSFLGAPSTRVH